MCSRQNVSDEALAYWLDNVGDTMVGAVDLVGPIENVIVACASHGTIGDFLQNLHGGSFPRIKSWDFFHGSYGHSYGRTVADKSVVRPYSRFHSWKGTCEPCSFFQEVHHVEFFL